MTTFLNRSIETSENLSVMGIGAAQGRECGEKGVAEAVEILNVGKFRGRLSSIINQFR